MSEITPENFKYLIKEKLNNITLRYNVKKATSYSVSKRNELFCDNRDEWEKLRITANLIRKNTLDNWDYYYSQLKDKFYKNGIEFFYANDSESTCKIVKDVIDSVSAKLIVKSKSMVTEEIGLNEYLEALNYEVVETDLGEFIIQLAGEKPSHITAPALHKSRKEIGELFHKVLNIEYTDAPEQLTRYARDFLREKFLNADVGISGANFLISETGTIVIVENEGNGRLTITLPETHIIISSIEKIVPNLNDTLKLLKLLTASATGQKITSYVSFITKKSNDNNLDGPKRIVVVLVDNGRSKLLKNKEAREILYCIKCGACMNICPVYQNVGGHAYGTVYPGPIGSILTPYISSFKKSKDLPYGSSLCAACSENCPVKINIHHQLLLLRKYNVNRKYTPITERLIFKIWLFMMNNYKIYNFVLNILNFLSPLFRESGLKVPVWSEFKYFPAPAEISFHNWWRKNINEKSELDYE